EWLGRSALNRPRTKVDRLQIVARTWDFADVDRRWASHLTSRSPVHGPSSFSLEVHTPLQERAMKAAACACVLVALLSFDIAAPAPLVRSLSALSTQPSMNVFRRFAADRAKMVGFYGDVLGLKLLPSIKLGSGEMILFQIGSGQVKLQATPAATEY